MTLIFKSGFNPSNGFVCLRTFAALLGARTISRFQSVERICVPSNKIGREHEALRLNVSIRRTDLCAFERRRRRAAAQQLKVSIRRTDLCAFERRRAGAPGRE